MKYYIDTENGKVYSAFNLLYEFCFNLTDDDRNGRSFAEYLNDCTNGNGFLEEVK